MVVTLRSGVVRVRFVRFKLRISLHIQQRLVKQYWFRPSESLVLCKPFSKLLNHLPSLTNKLNEALFWSVVAAQVFLVQYLPLESMLYLHPQWSWASYSFETIVKLSLLRTVQDVSLLKLSS